MVWQQLSDLRLLTQSKDYEPMTFPPVPKKSRQCPLFPSRPIKIRQC